MHDLIATRQHVIVAEWESRAQRLPGAGPSGRAALSDLMPDIVEGLPGSLGGVGTRPELHALARLEPGHALGTVVGELALLRDVILDLHRRERGVPPSHEELQGLGQAIDTTLTRVAEHLERSIRRRAEERLGRLQSLTAALSEALTPRRVMDVILTQGLEALGAQGGVVGLLSEDRSAVELVALPGHAPGLAARFARIPLDAPMPVPEAVRQECFITFSTREERDRRYPALAEAGAPFEAGAVAPLRTSNGVLGALAVSFLRKHVVDEAERDFLVTLAHQCAQALERARLYEAAQHAKSEAQASEAQLRTLLETLADGVVVLDEEGRFCSANPAARALLGLTPQEVPMRTYRDAAWQARTVAGHPLPESELPVARVLETREAVHGIELSVERPDRSRVTLSVNMAPLPGGGVVASARDVSAQKQQEARLRQRAEFERQLIGIVSHDLRGPLHAIQLATASLLRRGEALDERTLRSVSRIHSLTERTSRLVRDLLDFTRARLGHGIPLQRGPADFHALVREVVEEMQERFPEREVRLEWSGAGEGEWDAGRLAQVAENLVTNALKYSPPGTPVSVRTRGEEAGVHLEVHNGGAPIPPEEWPRLFQPLSHGAGRHEPGQSVGLGLYIVDQLARAHGGRVSMSSTVEGGTTFSVDLPRRPSG